MRITSLHGLRRANEVAEAAGLAQLPVQHGQLPRIPCAAKARSSNARSTGPFIGFSMYQKAPASMAAPRALRSLYR